MKEYKHKVPLEEWIDEVGLRDLQKEIKTHVGFFLKPDKQKEPEHLESANLLTRCIFISLRQSLRSKDFRPENVGN